MLNPLRRRFFGNSKRSSSRKENALARQSRRPRVETLEARHLLTGGLTLGALPAQTLLAGAPLQIPLNAVDTGGNPVTFSVSSSNPSISTSLPTTNPDLVLNITHTSSGQAGDTSFSGSMTIELFQNLAPKTVAQIESLVGQGVYTNTSFYRISFSDPPTDTQPFVIQGGLRTPPSSIPTIDNEINSDLRYTSAGVVGLARGTADDTGSSEFFISGAAVPFLDYQYTVFGRVVADPNNLRALIQSVPHDTNQQDANFEMPFSAVTITSATITNDANDLALQVSAPLGTTGSSTITVNVSDGHGGTDSKSFVVTVSGNATDPGPFLKTITPPTTTVNTPVTFQLPFFDLEPTVNPVTFSSQTASNPNLAVNLSASTGQVTVTPSNGLVGVQSLSFSVSSSVSTAPSTRTFPLFIDPAAPTGITLDPSSDTGASSSDGITLLNNSDSSHTLNFDVAGVTPGDEVILFDGSQQIGSAVAPGTGTTPVTVTVTTDGTHLLTNGPQQITAEQVLQNQPVTVGNYHGPVDLASPQSGPANVTIDASKPIFSSVPVTAAQVGVAYAYTVQATDVVQNGIVYTKSSGPTDLSVDPASGVVTWTPTPGEVGAQGVVLRATDLAGNTQDQSFVVNVSVAPPVTIVSTTTAANSTVLAGTTVPITVTFTSPVTVTGTPQLTLNITGAVANYVSGSGTSTLTFNYVVAAGQNSAQLDYASTMALSLNGGTIKGSGSVDAVLALPAIATDGLAAKHIKVGASVADLAITMTTSASTALPGGSIGFTITVTNNGPNDAQAVTLTDALPATLSFGVQKQTSGPTFTLSNNGNAISDTIATLSANASATFMVVADVNLSTAGGTVISNTATVSTSTAESDTSNNTATAATTVILTGVMLTTDSLDSTKNELVVSGTAGSDNVSFIPAAGGKILVNMDGKVSGPFAVSGRIVAYGQAGNNVIMVSPAITLPTFLYAGPGSDTLIGGSGDNVLVGGGGADVLIGGTGHNVLIAGSGPSRLYSTRLGALVGATSGSILIGGTTDFDHNDTALAAIMHEWGSSDSYATRVSKIKTGSLTASGVALTSTTVHSTKAVDQLYASAGWDWFLAPSPTDQILGISPLKKSLLRIN